MEAAVLRRVLAFRLGSVVLRSPYHICPVQLVAALVEAAERPHSPIAVPPSTVALIVDLLCFCVASHSYRIK